MPSKYTPNYQLSQWEAEDRVLRTDFNADNVKIDAALKAEANARTAADTAINRMLAQKGNCKVALTSYVGQGPDAGPTVISFPSMPLFVLVAGTYGICTFAGGAAKGGSIAKAESNSTTYVNAATLTWSGSTVSISASNERARMNMLNETYRVLAFYAMDK